MNMTENKIEVCYRCSTCLCLFVSGDLPFGSRVQCGVCGGKAIERMGVVYRKSPDKLTLEQTEHACKCNEVCVWAQGPRCECSCGGQNHQTGIRGYTRISWIEEKAAKIAEFHCHDPKYVDKHVKIATEFKSIIDDLALALSKRNNSRQSPYSEPKQIREARRLAREARFGIQHHTRMKKARQALALLA